LGWWVSGGVKSQPNQGVRKAPYVIIEVSIEGSVDLFAEPVARLFLLENQIMKQLTNYINAVSDHLASDIDLGVAYAKAQPIIMAMTPTKRTVWFHTNIAPLVAQAYKAELVLTRNGTTSFTDTKSGKRHDTALSKFRYVTQIKIEGKAKVVAKVDLVEKALELVESMTKSEQEKFFKRVSRK
jgi:hypothetical protein